MPRVEFLVLGGGVLLLCCFLLWGFVCAWHRLGTGRTPFAPPRSARFWGLSTALGLGGALLLRWTIDPRVAAVLPGGGALDPAGWIAVVLFSLGFERLFLCFAPFAFFARLLRRAEPAVVLTVVVDALVLLAQVGALEAAPAAETVVALFLARVVAGAISVLLLVHGGIWPVLWCDLLWHARLFPPLTALASS